MTKEVLGRFYTGDYIATDSEYIASNEGFHTAVVLPLLSLEDTETAEPHSCVVGCSREQALRGPWGSGRSVLLIYVTLSTMKVVRSSLLRTGRLYPQEFLYILVLIFRG